MNQHANTMILRYIGLQYKSIDLNNRFPFGAVVSASAVASFHSFGSLRLATSDLRTP